VSSISPSRIAEFLALMGDLTFQASARRDPVNVALRKLLIGIGNESLEPYTVTVHDVIRRAKNESG
jgi:hypothetical protein